jgi:hypothetical protein
VVAKYPDDTPAVVQAKCDAGWIILCGFHPEAPAKWRHGMSFQSPVADSHAYALTLIRAALEGTKLPSY